MQYIENLLHKFWQRSSDACPLEAAEAEKQEKEFANYVREKFATLPMENAAAFLMRYLADNHHPHTTAIVTNNRCEIVEGVKCFSTDDFIKD